MKSPCFFLLPLQRAVSCARGPRGEPGRALRQRHAGVGRGLDHHDRLLVAGDDEVELPMAEDGLRMIL